MKPERAFVTERALARHCLELLKPEPDPAALLPLLGRVGERLARRLAGSLAPLLGGEAPLVRCGAPLAGTAASLREAEAQGLAANSLFVVGPDLAPLLVSIDGRAVFRIVDRAFGGKGSAPQPLPDAFPMAAEMMIARLETMFAAQLGGAIDAVTDGAAQLSAHPAIVPRRRDGSLASLAPFAEDHRLAIMTITVEDDDFSPWAITLALLVTALPALLGMAATPAQAGSGVRTPPDPLAEPFGEVPLTLSALLVDMVLPFATIAALVPGQILPVSVARQVPLRAGEQIIAHGTVGAVDECVALQITRAFPTPRRNNHGIDA